MKYKVTRLGKCHHDFDAVPLKQMIEKNDAGTWGSDPITVGNSVVRSTNFNDTGYLDLSDVALRLLDKETFEEKKLLLNEIIIERSGGSETQPVGRVSFITQEVAAKEMAFANFIQRISVKEDIHPKFLFYCLYQMHSAGYTQIMQNQTNGIRNLEYRFFIKQILPKPKYKEQERIADILSTVDDSIKATKQSIAQLERLKKSLMQNLLTGKIKPDGTLRRKNEFYEHNKFGNVPIGWKVEKLGNCFDFIPTATYSRAKLSEKGNHKYIHYGDIHTKFNDFLDIQSCQLPFVTEEMAAKYARVIDGDLILSDTSEDYDGVGKGVEIKNVGDEYVIAGLHTLHLRAKKDDYINGFKSYILHHWKVRNSVLRIAVGIKVNSISKSSLSKIYLPIPTKEEQEDMANKSYSIDNNIQSRQATIKKLERLKKSLMQNLLTGKIRVSMNQELLTQTA